MMYDPLALSHSPTLITEQLTILKQVNLKSVSINYREGLKKVWNFPYLQEPPTDGIYYMDIEGLRCFYRKTELQVQLNS